jgi:CBS domain-containing protein
MASVPREFTIASSGTLMDAAARIEANHSRSVFVLSGDVVTGVISEGDILRALLRGVDIHAPLQDFVRYDFKYLRERDLSQALHLVRQFGITLIPVVDAQLRLVDVIRLPEILAAVSPSQK